jgi:DMSO/TMAO reductase YedYZ heme-binding membrane subunit
LTAPRPIPFIIALLLSAFAIGAALITGATPSDDALLAARWTARAALPLFLITYLASSVYRLTPNDVTGALLRQRRQWGLAFALSHSIHLVALLINITLYRPRPLVSLAGGALAYLFVYLMAITSTDRWQRRLGHRWKQLHNIGMHLTWAVFLVGYGSRAFHADPAYHLEGRIFASLCVAALAIRLWAKFGRGRRAQPV